MKQIILRLVVCSIFLAGSALAFDLGANKGTGINGSMPFMYFDSRTGHKYVKTDDNSYDEFSKKGKYLKTVPADLPLLMSGKKVYPVTEDFFILYKKVGDGKDKLIVLPCSSKHPKGSEVVKILVAIQ